MRRPFAIPILTALLLLLALVLALSTGEGDATPPTTTATDATPAPPTPTDAQPTTSPTRTAAATPTPPPPDPTTLLTYPATRTRGEVAGRVTDYDRIAIADAEVHLRPSFGGLHPLLAIADDRPTPPPVRTAPDGTFHFADVQSGPWTAFAKAIDGREGTAPLSAPQAAHEPPVVVVLGRAPASPELTIVVLEPEGATPVHGARVVVHRLTDLRSMVDDGDVPFASLSTDERGHAIVAEAPRDPLFVLARDDAGRVVAQVLDEPSEHIPRREIQLLLGLPTIVRGTFFGVDEARLRGSRVRALMCRNPSHPHYTCEGLAWSTPVEGLGFAFEALPAGFYALLLESPLGVRLDLPERRDMPNSVEPWVLEVPETKPTGAMTNAPPLRLPPMRVAEGAVLRGLVVTKDGAPVRSARVDLCFAPRTSNEPDGFEIYGALVWRLDFASGLARNHPEAHRVAFTDSAGRYELRGLHPGKWRVDVFATGLSHDQRCQVPVALAAPTELRHELEPAGVLQVLTDDISYLGVARPGAKDAKQLAIGKSGRVSFAGLAAGEWAVVTPAAMFDGPLQELARATVEAGRTTVVDLRKEGHVEIAGRIVFADGTPVAGNVQLHSHESKLGADGSFAFRLRYQLGRQFGLPYVDVTWNGLTQRLTLPEAAIEVDRWSGELTVGAESLRLTALDADGAPIAARVNVHQQDGPYGALLLAAGEVRELKGFGKGSVSLHTTSDTVHFAPQAVDLTLGNDIVLRGEPTSAIDVRVFDRAGLPVRAFPVAAVVWNGEGARPLRAEDLGYERGTGFNQQTGEDGTARLLVPPGLVRVGFADVYPLEGAPEPQLVEVTARASAQVVLRLR